MVSYLIDSVPTTIPQLTWLLVLLVDVLAMLAGTTATRERSRMLLQTSESSGVALRDLRRTTLILSWSRPVPAPLSGLVPLAQPIAVAALQAEARAYGRVRRVAPIVLPLAAALLVLSIVLAVIGENLVLGASFVGVSGFAIVLVEGAYLWLGPRMVSRRLRALEGPART